MSNNTTASAPQLVFVGGAPRSGTTLVQRLLGAHSRIYAGPEFDYVPRIVLLRNSMAASVRQGRISAIVDEQAVDVTIRLFLERIFGAKVAKEGCDIFSEKTPSNLLVFDELLDIFPEAKFIFVLRDPRDIVASMKEVKGKYRSHGEREPPFCRNVLLSAREINRYWSSGFNALKKSDRVKAVYYEDIIANPTVEAAKLCVLLGISPENSMGKIEDHSFENADVSSTQHWYSSEQLAGGITASMPRIYKNTLSKGEISVIESTIADNDMIARYNLRKQKKGLATWSLQIKEAVRSRALLVGRKIYKALA